MEQRHLEIQEGKELASSIPVIWARPIQKEYNINNHLVIWLTCFGGKKERVLPQLKQLAQSGFTAISFDLSEHAERTIGNESHEAMIKRVTSNRQLYFWPIIARTAEDFPRIIDWAVHKFNINGDILAGGISMGGDISLVAAAIDKRINGVCPVIATPDWLRPGSIDPQGSPDSYSQLLYDRYNPITNLLKYSHNPYIHFENAGADSFVPPEAAHRFIISLKKFIYSKNPERLTINELPRKEHGFHSEMWTNCLTWFNERVNNK